MSFLRKAILVNSTEFACLGLGIVQAALLARALGPAGVGQYDLIRSVLILASQLCCLGFPISFLYHSKHDSNNTKQYLMNVLWVTLFLGIISGVALVLLIVNMKDYFGFVPWLALLGIGSYILFLFGNVIARNALLIHIEARKLSLMRIVPIASSVILITILFFSKMLGVAQALLCFVFVALLGMVIGWFWVWRLVDFSINPSWRIIKKLGSMGIKLSWADLMILVNGQINIFIIRYLLNDFEKLGYFGRGFRVAMLVVLAGQAVMPLLFSRWASLPKEKLVDHVEKVLRFACSVSLVIITGTLLAGKYIVMILYGKEFMPAVTPMMILVPGAGLYLLSRTLMQLLGSQGKPEFTAVSLIISTITNAGLCWFLVPANGIVGAAWASMAGNIVLLLLLILIVKREYGVRISQCICLRKTDIKSIAEQILKK